eukprot:m.41537 g.41537  ORF g.41537 m.41537 type:complete len:141 (+) comp14223_c0_seq2:207-629(+)
MPAVGGAPHKLAGVKRLAAQAAAGLKAELTWRRPDGDFAYQFRVYTRKEGSGEWKLDTEKVPSDHLKPEYIYVTAATLEPTVRYWFKVEAYTMMQPEGTAVEVELISGEAPPSEPPTNLRVRQSLHRSVCGRACVCAGAH